MSNENMSWSDVAERDAAGFCPASPDYDQPHIVTDGATCDECGAEISGAQPRTAHDIARGILGPLGIDETGGLTTVNVDLLHRWIESAVNEARS